MAEASNVHFNVGPSGQSTHAFRAPSGGTWRTSATFLFLTGCAAILFYAYLHFSETGQFPSVKRNAGGFAASIVIGAITAIGLYWVNRWLDQRISWMHHFTSRFLTGLATNVLFALGILLSFGTTAIAWFGNDLFWNQGDTDDPDITWKIAILATVSVFIYKVIYGLLYAYHHYAKTQLENLKRERRQMELQFQALKSQISPHYLFNSLNTISSLLLKDIESAEQFIRRLALTYQYVLSTQNRKYVLLREELDFVQSYYYLLRIRFQQQLNVEINIPAAMLDTKIPPLTLQMLLENAVKHNTFAGDKKLHISIVAGDNDYLKVINTKTGSLENAPSLKVGLENIRQRYHYLTDKEILIENDDKFTVSLPVLHAQKENAEVKYSA